MQADFLFREPVWATDQTKLKPWVRGERANETRPARSRPAFAEVRVFVGVVGRAGAFNAALTARNELGFWFAAEASLDQGRGLQ
jgi:hypothetical protein